MKIRQMVYQKILGEMKITMKKKTKVMRISMQPSPMKIMIDQKQMQNVEYFKYLSSMMQGVHVGLNQEFPWQ